MELIDETNILLSNIVAEEQEQKEQKEQEQKEQKEQEQKEQKEQEQKEQKEQEQKEQKIIEEEKEKEGTPVLMELLEFEMNDNKIEFPATIMALKCMLKSNVLFSDNNERHIFFTYLEESFSKIVQDSHIDIKDIPELLQITNTVYRKFNKNVANDKINNYELTNVFLLTSMRLYLGMINNQDNNILHLFDKILCSAIELLRTQEVVHKKDLFSMFLCCK